MAGVKGRSGGARPNTGGKREGAGRKSSAPSPKEAPGGGYTARQYLEAVVAGLEPADAHRITAAKALLQKDEGNPPAKTKAGPDPVSRARFGAIAAPKLVVNKP